MLCNAGLLSVAMRECLLSRHGIIDADIVKPELEAPGHCKCVFVIKFVYKK